MTVRILQGDCRAMLATLPADSVHVCITSPPYFGLRSYLPAGHPDKAREMGSEPTLAAYIAGLVDVFREVRRVLRPDGVCFVNLGDGYVSNGRYDAAYEATRERGGMNEHNAEKYAQVDPRPAAKAMGLKVKDLMLVPQRVAIALCDDGWFLRSQMPWVKRSCMPESVTDRPTTAIEYVFQLTKSERYFWDAEAVRRNGSIPEGTRAAKGGNIRSELKDVNGRPPEYWNYTGQRNFRNSDLFFDSLTLPHGAIWDEAAHLLALDVNPEPTSEAHFAAYPTALVTPLIRAATSERGCCPACGAQWVRLLGEKQATSGRGSGNKERFIAGIREDGLNRMRTNSHLGSSIPWSPSVTPTTGWRASCSCDAGDPVPATVLDPFAGIGRTLLAADRMGRHAIGIELNPASVEIAWKLLQAEHPFERVSPMADPAPGPLFAEIENHRVT